MRLNFTVNPSGLRDINGNRMHRHSTGHFTVKSENRGVVCHSQRGLRGVAVAEIPDSLFLIPNVFPSVFWTTCGHRPVPNQPETPWERVGNEKK